MLLHSVQYIENIAFKITRLILIALVAGILLIYGGIFFILDEWNEYSILSISSALVALVLLIASLNRNSRERNSQNHWGEFHVREALRLQSIDLQNFIERLGPPGDLSWSPYDPYAQQLNKEMQDRLYKIRQGIGEIIYLGDLSTAEEVSKDVTSLLLKTPWLSLWTELSLAPFALGHKA